MRIRNTRQARRARIGIYFVPLLAMFCLTFTGCATSGKTAGNNNPRVIIETGLGKIVVEIDAAHAPVTAANFMRYVDGGFYTGGLFHRTVRLDNQPTNQVKIEVIQASANPLREAESFPPIPLERTSVTGLKHLDGTLSMARDGPDTGTSHIFICIGGQPELDFGGRRNPDGQGFAAFGRVIKGMDVVKRIQNSPAKGQTLIPPIKILNARRIK